MTSHPLSHSLVIDDKSILVVVYIVYAMSQDPEKGKVRKTVIWNQGVEEKRKDECINY